MTSFDSQYRQELPDGVVVERLPLGFAARRWWATFVCAVQGWEGRELPKAQPASVYDPDERLECVGGSGGGNEREYHYTWELVDHGASRAVVTYVAEEIQVQTESLDLDAKDRTGYFSTRLTDGSLIERLPVGHARGMWRLRWVRSDVPPTEIEAAARDDEAFGMPHERFVLVRSSDGPVHEVQASGAIGGPVQPFGVDLPDTVAHLEVDYLFKSELVNTELVPLSDVET